MATTRKLKLSFYGNDDFGLTMLPRLSLLTKSEQDLTLEALVCISDNERPICLLLLKSILVLSIYHRHE